MSEFQGIPKVQLSREETLAACRQQAETPPWWENRFQVKSQYLCDFLDRLAKDGYVYNEAAQRAFEQEHGLPKTKDSGTVLSTLVYNAQRYRGHDRLIREGWRPLTAEMVQQAMTRKAKIQVLGCNILGGTAMAECRPMIGPDGSAYVLLPKKRNKGFRADGVKPARIIPS